MESLVNLWNKKVVRILDRFALNVLYYMLILGSSFTFEVLQEINVRRHAILLDTIIYRYSISIFYIDYFRGIWVRVTIVGNFELVVESFADKITFIIHSDLAARWTDFKDLTGCEMNWGQFDAVTPEEVDGVFSEFYPLCCRPIPYVLVHAGRGDTVLIQTLVTASFQKKEKRGTLKRILKSAIPKSTILDPGTCLLRLILLAVVEMDYLQPFQLGLKPATHMETLLVTHGTLTYLW